MRILVIVGSPKGKDSITLHTCLYLEKQFPEHQFDYIWPGQRIKALEKDFSPALEALRKAATRSIPSWCLTNSIASLS